jgi:hypothetical protein
MRLVLSAYWLESKHFSFNVLTKISMTLLYRAEMGFWREFPAWLGSEKLPVNIV